MNSFRDISHFISKCVNFINLYLKDIHNQKEFYHSVLKVFAIETGYKNMQ